ncbi:tyrosine-protein phosphatase [Arthrobacter sp. FW306-2-2C-D06B]|uniref:tyrosine-protein phosphatase n=1 Tax=Arthrobacter sp. FW306-2-2C-D06B TaxID=2879618 RepID=UPI001F468487|nr:tyrosine-protein phosphatase [Arthrobacter sp. FW306-2-2C-D06B]UKA60028.1 tyrosine-protein phosphatase [Arthrobacter sp. FW306-2-2C-D06B]
MDGLVSGRDLGGRQRAYGALTPRGVFVRSENVDWITGNRWQQIHVAGIRTVVDLPVTATTPNLGSRSCGGNTAQQPKARSGMRWQISIPKPCSTPQRSQTGTGRPVHLAWRGNQTLKPGGIAWACSFGGQDLQLSGDPSRRAIGFQRAALVSTSEAA